MSTVRKFPTPTPTEFSPILEGKPRKYSDMSGNGAINLTIPESRDRDEDSESISAATWVATTWSSSCIAARAVVVVLGLVLIIGGICLIVSIAQQPQKSDALLRASKQEEGPPEDYGPLLQIPQGKLKWNILQSRGERNYYSFYKIPYAKPPLGDLRFSSPEPAEKWEGVRFETNVAPQCIQKVKYSPIIEAAGEEDCLYLNIYTPKLPGIELAKEELMPTLFYIHGGGFSDGNGSRYGGKYFMDEDAVLITFQYRLGPFGFLSTEDGTISGNMGMKDQIMAMRWCKENIKYFGGDPDRVMIFGNSAGAMSVNQIMASPMAAGLYHRAITQSGPSQGSTLAIRESQIKSFESLATEVGCLSTSNNEGRRNKRTLKCLRDLEAKDLAVIRGPDIVFAMTIETYEADAEKTEDKFLPDTIYNLLKSGAGNRVPWIIGVNSDEWIGVSANLLRDPVFMDALDVNWTDAMRTAFIAPLANCTPTSMEILEQARKFYFRDKSVSNDTMQELSNLLSDRDIIYPGKISGMIQSEFSDVYLYVLSKRPQKSYSDKMLAGFPPGDYGASHADELQYIFNYDGYPEYGPDSEYYSFSRYLIKNWVQFAATGETPDGWDPIKQEQNPISWFELKDDPKPTTSLQSRMDFWDQFTPEELCYV